MTGNSTYARFLSKDVITEFRGRGWKIRIRSLGFAEYYAGVGGDKLEVRTEKKWHIRADLWRIDK